MGVFEHFPYVNMHEMNTQWLLEKMIELDKAMETFKATESLKFADPIIWDITTQYEKSTIVLDPTGNAYLSIQAVPAGVQLNNDEYWLEIFNFTDYTRTANQNLTINTETNTTRATAAYQVDDWLIWNDVLYKVTSAIAIDDALIVSPAAGANLDHFTVEDFIKAFITYATELINQYKNDIDNSEEAFFNQMQAAFDTAVGAITVDSEVVMARTGINNAPFPVLKDAINEQLKDVIENHYGKPRYRLGGISAWGLPTVSTNRAYSTIKEPYNYGDIVFCTDPTYQFRTLLFSTEYYEAIQGSVVNYSNWDSVPIGITPTQQTTLDNFPWLGIIARKADDSDLTDADILNMQKSIIHIKAHSIYKNHGRLEETNITDCNDLTESGCYGFGTPWGETMLNMPSDYIYKAGTIMVFSHSFTYTGNAYYVSQFLFDGDGNIWYRLFLKRYADPSYIKIDRDWRLVAGIKAYTNLEELEGKTVAILGDSISTNRNTNYPLSAAEITIEDADVGVQLGAYITQYDVNALTTIDGYTFQQSDVGNYVTFTPSTSDVGKRVGIPAEYNPASITPWWAQMLSIATFTPIPVCWSGASVSSHEKNKNNFKTSYAWHPAQISKCGIRTPGTLNRTATDYIIIFRGANDMTHAPYTILPSDEEYLNNINWQYPTDDYNNGNYNFVDAMCLTISKLRTAYPTSKILLATFSAWHKVNYSHYPCNNGINTTIQYNNWIRKIADAMGCGLIDLDKCGITFENCSTYCRDTPPIHPNNGGHKLIANKALSAFVSQY